MLQLKSFLKEYFFPLVIISIFPCLLLFTSLYFQDYQGFKYKTVFFGDLFSWVFIIIYTLWAYLWIRLYHKKFDGMESDDGIKVITPKYSEGGLTYYLLTFLVNFTINIFYDSYSVMFYNSFPYLLGALNAIAFLLCFHLFTKSNVELKVMEHSDEDSHVRAFNSPSIENTNEIRAWSCIFKFYNGLQRHPLLFDVNLKQLVNSRIGMMLWQISIMNFGFYSYVMRSPYDDLINYGLFVNVILQTVYIYKFFYWEKGYYSTLDIIYDRAGFYICWGCLVLLPFLYTFSTYYFVSNKPTISVGLSVCFLLLGLVSITLNYIVDRQKQEFRNKKDEYKILGKKVEYIEVYYNKNGIPCNSTLLISGFWGITRHMNYTFEILLALFWCMPGYNLSVYPFMYLIFLTILLVHRVFRDEKRCHQKYSNQWLSYCKIVKWRMIPFVF